MLVYSNGASVCSLLVPAELPLMLHANSLVLTWPSKNLGIHWASSVPGFLALMCLPFPYIFYKYGESIRLKCKYASEAHETMMTLRKTNTQVEREGKEKETDS